MASDECDEEFEIEVEDEVSGDEKNGDDRPELNEELAPTKRVETDLPYDAKSETSLSIISEPDSVEAECDKENKGKKNTEPSEQCITQTTEAPRPTSIDAAKVPTESDEEEITVEDSIEEEEEESRHFSNMADSHENPEPNNKTALNEPILEDTRSARDSNHDQSTTDIRPDSVKVETESSSAVVRDDADELKAKSSDVSLAPSESNDLPKQQIVSAERNEENDENAVPSLAGGGGDELQPENPLPTRAEKVHEEAPVVDSCHTAENEQEMRVCTEEVPVQKSPSLEDKTAPSEEIAPKVMSPDSKKPGIINAAASDSVPSPTKVKEEKIEDAVIKRKEPLSEVALYVDSLTQLSFDWKKYTCFYCRPCHAYVTCTAKFEEHMNKRSHLINLVRWRMAGELKNEKLETDVKLQNKIIDCKDFITGVDKIVEIAPDKGGSSCFVCILCNFVCSDIRYLSSHLSGFDHIDSFMEYVSSHSYKPPTRSSLPVDNTDNMRVVDNGFKGAVMVEARKFVTRNGVGKVRVYRGNQYRDWVHVKSDMKEMEDELVKSQMENFLTDWSSMEIKADVLTHLWSSANFEYKKMSRSDKEKYIGLQYLVELWAPSRRAIAVWYCTLCDSLVIDWTKHCDTMQHVAVYLKKDYQQYVFDCLLLEADSEEQMRQILTIAKSKVLQFENCQARVKYVIQIHALDSIESFVAINAKIAKLLVDNLNLSIGPLPRRSRNVDALSIVQSIKGPSIDSKSAGQTGRSSSGSPSKPGTPTSGSVQDDNSSKGKKSPNKDTNKPSKDNTADSKCQNKDETTAKTLPSGKSTAIASAKATPVKSTLVQPGTKTPAPLNGKPSTNDKAQTSSNKVGPTTTKTPTANKNDSAAGSPSLSATNRREKSTERSSSSGSSAKRPKLDSPKPKGGGSSSSTYNKSLSSSSATKLPPDQTPPSSRRSVNLVNVSRRGRGAFNNNNNSRLSASRSRSRRFRSGSRSPTRRSFNERESIRREQSDVSYFPMPMDLDNFDDQIPAAGQQPPTQSAREPSPRLNEDDLLKFTDLLKSVGVDMGRPVLVDDLPMIRGQFADPESFDALLGSLLSRSGGSPRKTDPAAAAAGVDPIMLAAAASFRDAGQFGEKTPTHLLSPNDDANFFSPRPPGRAFRGSRRGRGTRSRGTFPRTPRPRSGRSRRW